MEHNNNLQSITVTKPDFLQTHYPSINKETLSKRALAAFSITMIQDALIIREIDVDSIISISSTGYLAIIHSGLNSLNLSVRQRVLMTDDVFWTLINRQIINCINDNLIELDEVLHMNQDTLKLLKKPYTHQWIKDAPSCIRDLIDPPPPLYELLTNPTIIYRITLEKIPPTTILSLSPFCHTFLNSALVKNALDRNLISLTNILKPINRLTEHSVRDEHAMSHERASLFFTKEIEEQEQIQRLGKLLNILTKQP